ncbi:MAG: hypothetical protein ACD_10C00554G0001, partial [uncultured bacterium]
MIRVQKGPAIKVPSSTTFKPASGFCVLLISRLPMFDMHFCPKKPVDRSNHRCRRAARRHCQISPPAAEQ